MGTSPRFKLRLKIAHIIGGLAAFCLAASPLQAGELSAMAGESINLGRFHGVVYYTSEHDGYRVVATITDDEAGSPVRFSSTLAEGQSAAISVPGKEGKLGSILEISRSGAKITLTEVGSTHNHVGSPEL
ncbi:hypothetical protein BLM14_20850 (plasmid) [Phyllobacterium zundukense]|nr:hypothetical protein BLM14_20850 [Phyllobacterium zundukense]